MAFMILLVLAPTCRSFAKDLGVSSRGYLDEALLAMVLVGITIVVTGEMLAPRHGWMDIVGRLLPFDAFGIISHSARERSILSLLSMLNRPRSKASCLLSGRQIERADSPGMWRSCFAFLWLDLTV